MHTVRVMHEKDVHPIAPIHEGLGLSDERRTVSFPHIPTEITNLGQDRTREEDP